MEDAITRDNSMRKADFTKTWWETVYIVLLGEYWYPGFSGEGIQRANRLTFFSRLVYRANAVSIRWSVSVEIPRCAPSSFLLEKPDACRFIVDIYLPKRRHLGKHSRFVAYKTSDDEHTIHVQQGINAQVAAMLTWLWIYKMIGNKIYKIFINRRLILIKLQSVFNILIQKILINLFYFCDIGLLNS